MLNRHILHVSVMVGAILIGVGGSGCTSRFTQADNPIEIDSREYRRMYHATMLVLRDYGFPLDRQDYRFGIITTRYLPAPTGFEIWDSTNTTGYQALESTLNHQRRKVTVTFDSLSDAPPVLTDSPDSSSSVGLGLRVEVWIERLQNPGRHLNGSTRGHSVVATLSGVPGELAERGVNHLEYWQPLGRDPYLEQRLVASIVRKSFDVRLPGS